MKSYLVFLLVISLLLMKNCEALGGRKILGKEYITVDVNSFLSTSCKASVQGRSRPGSLKVTHRYTHCSTSGLNNSYIEPSLAEILARDQIRVASIQNKHHVQNTKSNIDDDLGVSKATISAKPDGGSYVVLVGLGTPTKFLTLIFDTGSSLTWTQCQPCARHCYRQKDSIFDPSASTSYRNASCDSAQCSQLSNLGYPHSCTAESTCVYGVIYGDDSSSIGNLANERLTLTPNDMFDNFLIGCGENNQDTLDDTDGILGLGRDDFSVVSQTAQKYGKQFSYCLPTQSGSNGYLTFGNDNTAAGNIVYTPLGNGPDGQHYSLSIVAISVGGTQLAISPSVFQAGRTIIDSGTTITRLPLTAYTALRDAIKQQMSQYTWADTCFDVGSQGTITFPLISFVFQGNVKVDLDAAERVFLKAGGSVYCLAFIATDEADPVQGIFGSLQQQTLQVVYDVAGGKLGFGTGGCS